MSATAQADLGTFNYTHDKPLNLPSAIYELLREHGKWRGTTQELANALGLDIAPRSLSVALQKLKDELEKVNIYVSHKKIRGKKILHLSFAQKQHSIATLVKNPIRTPPEEGVANYEGKITFPFEWRYGMIKLLSEEEKATVNQPRGRKRYHKPCALCGGNGGHLEYRKVSDGNSSLLCEFCAEAYVRSALNLAEWVKNLGE